MVSIESGSLRLAPFPMSLARLDSSSVLWLQGDHDIATSAALSAAIAEAIALDGPAVVIDMSGVLFISAATVGVIVQANVNLRARSRSLTLRAPSSCVRHIFDVCGLSGLLEEACAAGVLGDGQRG